ncbi:hypothetical protein [Erwinia tasmaniensis]|uniref:hypothetical protein n=1 Tax=Erwinia tasmaniensis TaxID=338565 RepID=UPI003A4D7940
MKKRILLLLIFPTLVFAQPHAVIFVDTAMEGHSLLIENLNQMLFYSPTLQSQLQVDIYDINPRAPAFRGGVHYHHDIDGQMLSRFRPTQLPCLICLNGEVESLRLPLINKEQLCLCLKSC